MEGREGHQVLFSDRMSFERKMVAVRRPSADVDQPIHRGDELGNQRGKQWVAFSKVSYEL